MEDQVVVQKSRSEGSGLNIKELFFKYLRFLPLYIICVVLALAGSYVYLRYATESYRATGTLLIRDDKTSPSVSDKIDVALQSDARKNVQTEVEVIRSRPLMVRVVKALDLNFIPYGKGRFKEQNQYKMVPYKAEAIRINDSSKSFTIQLKFRDQQSFYVNGGTRPVLFNQQFSTPAGQFRIVRLKDVNVNAENKLVWTPVFAQAVSLLNGLVISPKQNTGIVNIVVESANPFLSADLINQLMEEYRQANIEDKNAATRQTIAFIDGKLQDVESDLENITQKFVAYQKANNIIEPQTQSQNYFNRVEEARRLEQDQRLRLSSALQLQEYLQNRDPKATVPSSLGIDDPTLNSLIAGYNKAQLERNELLENAPPGNVVVQQKTEEVQALRSKILENVKNIRGAYGSAIGTLRSTSGEAISQIKTLPVKRQDLVDIQRQLESKAKIYNDLLTKREESNIALASTISNTKILQESVADTTPVKPNRQNTKILALLVGLLIPTIVIIVMELLNDKITSRGDIERLTSATILGEVGHSEGIQTLIVTHGNRKVIAEQFRILRSNLQYVLNNIHKPVILVTSSFSGEGKSFLSTNMGAVMALANKKTIILEFDIRKPKVMSGLGLGKHPGLTNYIIGKAKLEDLPVPVPGFDNLFILPCGPIPPNPAELLLDPKLTELFDHLRERFDVVIVDTAPVGMVSDAMTLSKYADCTLYVVRQGYTFKKQISIVDDYFSGKLPRVSIIINDVTVGAGGYGRYGYGTGGYYSSGYFEDESKQQTGFGKWLSWLGMKNGTSKKHKKQKV